MIWDELWLFLEGDNVSWQSVVPQLPGRLDSSTRPKALLNSFCLTIFLSARCWNCLLSQSSTITFSVPAHMSAARCYPPWLPLSPPPLLIPQCSFMFSSVSPTSYSSLVKIAKYSITWSLDWVFTWLLCWLEMRGRKKNEMENKQREERKTERPRRRDGHMQTRIYVLLRSGRTLPSPPPAFL